MEDIIIFFPSSGIRCRRQASTLASGKHLVVEAVESQSLRPVEQMAVSCFTSGAFAKCHPVMGKQQITLDDIPRSYEGRQQQQSDVVLSEDARGRPPQRPHVESSSHTFPAAVFCSQHARLFWEMYQTLYMDACG